MRRCHFNVKSPVSRMINGERSKASPFEFCQVIASLACIAVSISAIAMSVKTVVRHKKSN